MSETQTLDIAEAGLIEGGSHRPLALDHQERIFVVRRGHFDVFATTLGALAGRRHHLFRVETGGVLYGIDHAGHRHGLVAVGSIGSAVESVGPEHALSVPVLESWIVHLSQAGTEVLTQWPDRIAAAGRVTLAAGERLAADPYHVQWIEVETGTVELFGHLPVEAGQRIPLAAQAWIAAKGEAALSITAFGGDGARELALFNSRAIDAVTRLIERQAEEEQRKSDLSRGTSRHDFDAAMADLAGSALRQRGRGPAIGSADALDAAVAALLRALNVTNEDFALARGILSAARGRLGPPERFEHVLNRLRLGRRRVMLQPSFWASQGPPMLVWRGDDRTPAALVYRQGHGWEITDGRGSQKFDRAKAGELAQDAVQLYPTFSAKPLTFRDLFGFGGIGLKGDLIRLGLASLTVSGLALAVPVGSHFLIDSVIPDGRVATLWIVIAGLVVAALSGSVFELIKGVAVLRAETQFETRLQPALFERLIRLPTAFYRAHTIGDIADRVMGIQAAREILSGSVVGAALSGVFGLVSLVPLFFYDSRLALVGVGLSIVVALVSVALSYGQLRHERERFRHQGKLDGFVVQMLVGISKLRAAAAEPRAMAQWTTYFVAQRNRFVSAQTWQAAQTVVMAFLPTVASAVIYGAMAYWLKADLEKAAASPGTEAAPPLSAADFVAFVAAFGQVMGALTGMATALTRMLNAVPLIERAQPLITTPIEVPQQAEPPGVLTGDIELKHIKFRYIADGPMVLDDVSLRIEPGQFVAIVGPSGSGKSTIARLMLGFERPEVGDIFFGGKSSERIDMTALRRQVGVVLQHGRISSGSVYDNIVGDARLGLDEAWAVAQLVGLEQDIRDMPMGMHTVLLDGGATLSGGQRQRILIARALVRKPRILLLDEATSALDNRTQAIVTDTLGKLSITRMVIAHRLSTIQSVDRVFVMERGKLIESGTYDELMNKDGAFAALAKRQML